MTTTRSRKNTIDVTLTVSDLRKLRVLLDNPKRHSRRTPAVYYKIQDALEALEQKLSSRKIDGDVQRTLLR